MPHLYYVYGVLTQVTERIQKIKRSIKQLMTSNLRKRTVREFIRGNINPVRAFVYTTREFIRGNIHPIRAFVYTTREFIRIKISSETFYANYF